MLPWRHDLRRVRKSIDCDPMDGLQEALHLSDSVEGGRLEICVRSAVVRFCRAASLAP